MKAYLIISAFVITFLFPVYGHADTFCVSDATGLQTALTTASGKVVSRIFRTFVSGPLPIQLSSNSLFSVHFFKASHI